jgi:3-oxoadipate enol-lactonase
MNTDLLDTPAVPLAPGLFGRVSGSSEGEGVLWIHGYTLDSRTWGAIWPLVPGYRHVGVDLPGHGASEPRQPGSTLTDLGERLASLASAQQIRHIVALSFGTVAALQLLIARPSLFASCVLAAPGIAGGPTEPRMIPVYSKMGMLMHFTGRTAAITDLWLSSPAWQGIGARPGLSEAMKTVVDAHTFAELRDRSGALLHHPPQTAEAIATIKTPVLIIAGDREMPAYKTCAQMLASSLQRCRIAELEDTDHLCLLQRPERGAELIAEHLRQCRERAS